MVERKQRGIYCLFQSTKNIANDLLKKSWDLNNTLTSLENHRKDKYWEKRSIEDRINKIHNEMKSLIHSYNNNIFTASEAIGLKLISLAEDGKEASINQLIVGCDTVIGVLENDMVGLSSGDMDNLSRLKKEISDICKELEPHFEKNINEAVIETEKGHFLASSLIISRIVDYVLDHINGKEIEEKIQSLDDAGAFEQERRIKQQQTEKISRLSRNIYNHRIDTYPNNSDVFTLLGDCIFLLKIYKKILKNNEKKV